MDGGWAATLVRLSDGGMAVRGGGGGGSRRPAAHDDRSSHSDCKPDRPPLQSPSVRHSGVFFGLFGHVDLIFRAPRYSGYLPVTF